MSQNICDMFKKQRQKFVPCPACEVLMLAVNMNKHLDSECISSPEADARFKVHSSKFVANSTLVSKNGSGSVIKLTDGSSSTSSDECFSVNERTEEEDDTFQPVENVDISENIATVATELKVNTIQNEIASEVECVGHPLTQYNDTSIESLPDGNRLESEKADMSFSQDGDSPKLYTPYYLANFKHIIKCVLEDDENTKLFNEDDMKYINSFNSISVSAQKLYVRLFQRKFRWHRQSKIIYHEIAADLSCSFKELAAKSLIDSDISSIDLETALDLLSLSEMKTLGKQFSVISLGKSKKDIIQLLLKHSRQHKSFFSSSKSSINAAILKKVQLVLGPCCKLSLEPKKMFTRILMLFSLPSIGEDEDEAAGGQQQQLFTLLQINKGELKFPQCNGKRITPIFDSRDDLIRFENAKQMENDILIGIENKSFEPARQTYEDAVAAYQTLLKDGFPEKDLSLPPFLRRYTAGHVYTRCLWLGVEVLQKLRRYQEAVDQLNILLSQKVYCQDYRPRWWDRLALNLEQHLKQRVKAVAVVKEALQDARVRGGHRLSILTRAHRLSSVTDQEEIFKNQVAEALALTEAPKVIIRGRLFPCTKPGRKHVFISSGSRGSLEEVTVLNVENLALEHYKSEGFTEGIHGEGSTFISIYGLLFWDIIYNGDIPDVFISPYQGHPLDLNCDSFFQNRETEILSHLNQIRNSSIEALQEIVASTWNSHSGEVSIVGWDLFDELEKVQSLIKCMGVTVITGICERLTKDFRHTRSGVPDLVVWSPKKQDFKIVEVKGPGDRLSSKQMLWIDYLIKIGAQVELCLVEAVGAKRLKRDES